jgi:hypothetical protein
MIAATMLKQLSQFSKNLSKEKASELVNLAWILCIQIPWQHITCQRVSARQCFIGDVSFQWERPIFEGPPIENPLTDRYQILNKLLPS